MTTETKHGIAKGYPWVKGICPACDGRTLFVGDGGYVTCSYIPCPDPGAAGKLLEGSKEAADGD